jgi:hypothetical protein
MSCGGGHLGNPTNSFMELSCQVSLVKEIVKYWEDDTPKVMTVGPVGQNVLYLIKFRIVFCRYV